jgi:F-type H+-transporting ATPase subunit delta
MRDRKLATRYARALLESLPAEPQAERADEFLTALREALEESADLRGLLFDPAVPRATRKSVLRKLAEDNLTPPQVGNFLATVVDHNRAASLPSIAEVFRELREERAGILPAEIATARPLSDDLKERTLRALERMTGRKVRLTTRVEPELLGGAVTRIGSEIQDGSLRTQLAQLRRRMLQE